MSKSRALLHILSILYRFADNVVLLAFSDNDIQCALAWFTAECEAAEMSVNWAALASFWTLPLQMFGKTQTVYKNKRYPNLILDNFLV